MKHAYLVGKGKSLDNVTEGWFDETSSVWCLNQSADVIRGLLPKREVHCVQNDPWINYSPPISVFWHCRSGISIGKHPKVQTYCPETLTGNWASPTCLCALELMHQSGIDCISMIGFDSYFDSSRTYANCINVKADEIAPFEFYNSVMRRYAIKRGISLHWVDKNGIAHIDNQQFKNTLVAVAMGNAFVKQTEGMIRSFLALNPDWSVERFYDNDINKLLPDACRTWSSFNKCELGRWLAMKKCLESGYDTVVYSDGDIRWYGKYDISIGHDMVIYPHYVTNFARQNAKHLLQKDGIANIGIIEISRSIDHDRLFDFVIGEVLHSPTTFMHGQQLWLQNLVSTIPDCGFDCVYNTNCGYNVASWNLRKGDREVYKEDGKYLVRTNTGIVKPLVSFHFSSKSLGKLVHYGNAVQQLFENYIKEGVVL